jgi:hypothetical protein
MLQGALLAVTASGWFTDLLSICSQLKLSTISERSLGLTEDVNPYGLPLIEKPDAILICMNWYAWLAEQGEAVVDRVFARLRSRCPLIVGLEGFDLFSLRMPPEGLDRIDLLLKAQGVYRDRELYNYEVGPYYPGANWIQKLRKSSRHYSNAQLDKIRLSLPCFVGSDRRVRTAARRLKAAINPLQRVARELGDWWGETEAALLHRMPIDPPHTAHCLVALSHVQRLELLLALKRAGVTGLLGVSVVPEYIWGTSRFEDEVPEEERERIRGTIRAAGLHDGPMSRNRFKRTMLNHKVVIAPTGYGELTFRHAEAWEQGRALVCQDLSHVETLFPFRDRENVLYCKPDFSDLPELLTAVELEAVDYEGIGRQGRRDWQAWVADLDGLFERGVLGPIRSAGAPQAPEPAHAALRAAA